MAPAPVVAGSNPTGTVQESVDPPATGTSVPAPPTIDLDAAVEAGASVPEIITDPQIAVAFDGSDEILAFHTFTHTPLGYRSIPIWRCHFFAVKGASGSSFGLGIDAVRGTITPSAGEWVLLSCTDGRFVRHEETFAFDPDRPLGSWEAT